MKIWNFRSSDFRKQCDQYFQTYGGILNVTEIKPKNRWENCQTLFLLTYIFFKSRVELFEKKALL